MGVLLALMTIALYWPATGHDFFNCDDPEYVLKNPHVTSGLTLENVRWAFSALYANNWHPLTWISHQADCQLFGFNPAGHHLTGVLLHSAATVLVFVLLRSLTGTVWRSFLVAALFGWHPAHVESVAWVAERKDVLSTCFGLMSLIFYTCHVHSKKEGHTGNYWLAWVCFAAGLMSKPMLVTWPFILLLLDYWPLRRLEPSRVGTFRSIAWRRVQEKIPFFALAAAASAITYVAQKSGGAVVAVANLPLGGRAENGLISYCRYLGKLFWPADFAVFYPHPGQWPWEQVLLAGGLLGLLSLFAYGQRHRHPFLIIGWLWFLGTLFPVIGWVQVGTQAMADRYTYIPAIGIFIAAVWGASALIDRWPRLRWELAMAGCVFLLINMGLTHRQLGYWKDSESLFRHAIEVTRKNHFAQAGLGTALYKKGRLEEAVLHYEEALRLNPQEADLHSNLATVLCDLGRPAEAVQEYQTALRLRPNDAEIHFNLGTACEEEGQAGEALSHYQEALRLQPDFPAARHHLGNALLKQGRLEDAIREYQELIRLKPDEADARNNLGVALFQLGQGDEALRQFQEVLRLQPKNQNARDNLNRVLELRKSSNGPTDTPIKP